MNNLKLSDVKIGDELIAYDHQDLNDGDILLVHEDDVGSLWVFSREGHHYLDEDTDSDGILYGFKKN